MGFNVHFRIRFHGVMLNRRRQVNIKSVGVGRASSGQPNFSRQLRRRRRRLLDSAMNYISIRNAIVELCLVSYVAVSALSPPFE